MMKPILLSKRFCRLTSFYRFASSVTDNCSFRPKFCVVGGGPAGFYAAKGIAKAIPNASVDIYEKMPVPFGLIRFGVAPDRPDVKNTIVTLTNFVASERVTFNGNVTIGRDISLQSLQDSYHAIVICTGAEDDKQFGIPGENLPNVISARNFVGWYNGVPDDVQLSVNLDVESVAVFGHGNVALDVTRILLSSVDDLKKTDITGHSLEVLSRSRVRKVYLIGRRGPLQVSFDASELRMLTKLKGCRTLIDEKDFAEDEKNAVADTRLSERRKRRLTSLMLQNASSLDSCLTPSDHAKEWQLVFRRSPSKFLASNNGNLSGVLLDVNALEGSKDKVKAVPTGRTETLECGLVLRSIGYKCRAMDPSVPVDPTTGIILNKNGRISGRDGMYCSGWVATGPLGEITSTMNGSLNLSQAILEDIKTGRLDVQHPRDGRERIWAILKNKGVQIVSFEDWKKIDYEEKRLGNILGKPREKLVKINEMLRFAK